MSTEPSQNKSALNFWNNIRFYIEKKARQILIEIRRPEEIEEFANQLLSIKNCCELSLYKC